MSIGLLLCLSALLEKLLKREKRTRRLLQRRLRGSAAASNHGDAAYGDRDAHERGARARSSDDDDDDDGGGGGGKLRVSSANDLHESVYQTNAGLYHLHLGILSVLL